MILLDKIIGREKDKTKSLVESREYETKNLNTEQVIENASLVSCRNEKNDPANAAAEIDSLGDLISDEKRLSPEMADDDEDSAVAHDTAEDADADSNDGAVSGVEDDSESDTAEEIDLVEMKDGRFVIRLPDGRYPKVFGKPLIPAEQFEEDDRFREDISANISESGLYRIYASSLRGFGKRRRYHPEVRQDGYAVGFVEDRWAIGVVADGVSAATKSHLLADYIAKYAASHLEHVLENCSSLEGVDWDAESEIIKTAAYEFCRDKCEQQRLFGAYIDYFASTLEFVVVGTAEANSGEYAYVSVAGDGNCYVFNEEGFTKALKNEGGREDNYLERPHSEAVKALPEDPGKPFVSYGSLNVDESLLITTDGYSKIGGGETQEASYLFERLNGVSSISSYLQVMDFDAKQNDDDRTGIMIRRKKHVNNT